MVNVPRDRGHARTCRTVYDMGCSPPSGAGRSPGALPTEVIRLIAHDLHDDEVRHAERVYTTAYLRLEAAVPGFAVEDIEGLTHIRYGRPKAGLSHELYVGETPSDVVLDVVARHPDLADAFIATYSRHDEVDPALDAAGYVRIVRNFLMRLDVGGAAGRPDDQIVRLTTVAEVERLAGLREDDRIIPGYLDDPSIACYALMTDDVPVASAVVITDGDTAVVEYVHTLERYRRLGYGRWLMRGLHRLAANDGARWVVLSSNERGRPLYDALGYQLLSYEDIYRRQDIP